MTGRLNVAEVTREAAHAVREYVACELVGISVAGGSGYAELLVRVHSPDGDPRRLSLGVFRTATAADFRHQVAMMLSRALNHESRITNRES